MRCMHRAAPSPPRFSCFFFRLLIIPTPASHPSVFAGTSDQGASAALLHPNKAASFPCSRIPRGSLCAHVPARIRPASRRPPGPIPTDPKTCAGVRTGVHATEHAAMVPFRYSRATRPLSESARTRTSGGGSTGPSLGPQAASPSSGRKWRRQRATYSDGRRTGQTWRQREIDRQGGAPNGLRRRRCRDQCSNTVSHTGTSPGPGVHMPCSSRVVRLPERKSRRCARYRCL
ncbi:hypothetical protein LXA43DRAFT_1030829 [Ganoderma leucocontextum]|nr:hypothetical protein LXA43DRAFT_1030829 [Ganoderma leucocontextum]